MCNSKFTTHNYACKSDNESEEYRTSYVCRGRKNNHNEPTCPSSAINHTKVEHAFIEYIQNISDIAEDNTINVEEIVKNAERELLEAIVDHEKKLSKLQDRKKQVMAQYVQGVIEFDEYKSMIKVFNEQYELQRKKAELATTAETPEVFPEDIIANLKQNWENLRDSEKMIFLQRFVKRIVITVEREKGETSIVKIDKIEFYSGGSQPKEMVRSQLRRNSMTGRRHASSVAYFSENSMKLNVKRFFHCRSRCSEI